LSQKVAQPVINKEEPKKQAEEPKFVPRAAKMRATFGKMRPVNANK